MLYRFSRDLRLDDHAGLAAAAEHGEILPVLVLDEALREHISRSPRRAAFYCEAVAALDQALRARGTQLLVRHGPLIATLLTLAKDTGASAVVWGASYDARAMEVERDLQSRLEERGLRALIVHDSPAIPPEETAMEKSSAGEGYRALVPYVEKWRALEVGSFEAPLFMRFAPLDSLAPQNQALPAPEEFGSSRMELGATPRSAADQLAQFLAVDALQYSVAANVPADDRTSHLSAHLSVGTIAARTVVRETKRRLDDPFLLTEEKASLKRYLRGLAQRDFFLQLMWFNPQTAQEPLQEKMRAFPFAKTHPALDAWKAGRTGYPIVDAGIRQLRATGWMHPRVRSIAASFLCFDLGVDWKVGLAEWDRHFIEDDPALSNGNWQWIAGVGADLAAYPRIYNPIKQARRFDAQGTYVRRYIPELADRFNVVQPRGTRTALELPLFGPNTYPDPVVDHEKAARDFLTRYNVWTATDRGASVRQSSR
ncbi:MAG: deoxyribodipyrimidine photo-lyase [Candidatus Baltobacteraceae bacterium]